MAGNQVEQAIRSRATIKVMAETDLPVRPMRSIVEQLIATAGWAPFHRPCDSSHQANNMLSGIEPWRMHALDAQGCRELRRRLPVENAGKLPTMLAAADALIQVTWLPNPVTAESTNAANSRGEPILFTPTVENMEHIAATAAAIQNLLLSATSLGIRNYWSSGGLLREPQVFQWLSIPSAEILLGSIFLFGPPQSDAIEVGSKLRDKRSELKQWMRWVEL